MREIKLRGKAINRSGWLIGDYRCYGKKVWIVPFGEDPGVDAHRVDPKTVGEYTGLHDKNEKEIFEGDILNSHFIDACYVIEWNDSSASWFPRELKLTGTQYGTTWKDRIIKDKIIGNIYDNPELL